MKSDRAASMPSAVAIAILAVLLRIFISVATHFTQEDSLITLRYAENIAHGHGFVYNSGERVLGTTTPLYTLFLALMASVGLPAISAGKALNICADGLLCLVVWRWLRGVGQEGAGLIAAFFMAVNPIQIRVAISGQETALAALCGAFIWLAFAERRYNSAYLTAAALFLLRWDSLLLLAVLTGAIVLRERRLPRRAMLLYAALIAPWLIFATWYFGSPIPVTLAAKATVYGWRFQSVVLPELSKVGFRFFGTPTYALVTVFACIGLWRIGHERWRVFYPPVLWFFLYWSAFLLSKVLLFEWYLVPPLPIYAVIAALGLETMIARVPGHIRQIAAVAAMLLVAPAAGWLTFSYTRETQRVEDHLRIPMGLWLRAHCLPTDRIMLEPIGYIGYYSQRKVVDVVGLVTPAVLRYYVPANPAPMLSIAKAFRPEWCVLRPGEIERIQRAANAAGTPWEAHYNFVRSFSYTSSQQKPLTVFYVYHRR